MSKGSSRRKEDFGKIQSNWDNIPWGYIRCSHCYKVIDSNELMQYPIKYIRDSNGGWSHISCITKI